PPEINGVAFTLKRLVDGLRDRRHDVSIVRPRRAGGDPRAGVAAGRGMLVPGAPAPGHRGVRVGWPASWRRPERRAPPRADGGVGGGRSWGGGRGAPWGGGGRTGPPG